jgi:hypothetical protein
MTVVASGEYAHEERTSVAWVVRYLVSPRLLANGDERAVRVQKYDPHRRSDLWPAFQSLTPRAFSGMTVSVGIIGSSTSSTLALRESVPFGV